MIDFHMNSDSESGARFRQMLLDRGLEIRTIQSEIPTAIVNYGGLVSNPDRLPCLNERAGRFNKFEALQLMAAAGVSVPPHCVGASRDPQMYPCLGRAFKHSKGRDIVWLGHPEDMMTDLHRRAGHVDYSIKYIPVAAEYRAWVFQDRCLAVYRKVLHEPEEVEGRTGSKWYGAFGYEFQEAMSVPLQAQAVQAVSATGLDWGAVDILFALDMNYYVIEVNTEPWNSPRLRGALRLARAVEGWVRNL